MRLLRQHILGAPISNDCHDELGLLSAYEAGNLKPAVGRNSAA